MVAVSRRSSSERAGYNFRIRSAFITASCRYSCGRAGAGNSGKVLPVARKSNRVATYLAEAYDFNISDQLTEAGGRGRRLTLLGGRKIISFYFRNVYRRALVSNNIAKTNDKSIVALRDRERARAFGNSPDR